MCGGFFTDTGSRPNTPTRSRRLIRSGTTSTTGRSGRWRRQIAAARGSIFNGTSPGHGIGAIRHGRSHPPGSVPKRNHRPIVNDRNRSVFPSVANIGTVTRVLCDMGWKTPAARLLGRGMADFRVLFASFSANEAVRGEDPDPPETLEAAW